MLQQTPGYHGFEQALRWLKGGRKIARKGWNGHGMFIYLVRQHKEAISEYSNETYSLIGFYGEGIEINFQDRIDMRYANGNFGTWSPSHEDILSNDWHLVM